MESGFGKRLFRLFLLFSLVPSTLLALLGYYLTSESTAFRSAPMKNGVEQLENHYREFVSSRIGSALILYQRGVSVSELGLDFTFTALSGSISPLSGDTLLDSIAFDDLTIRPLRDRLEMIETKGAVLAYRCIMLPHEVFCGGYAIDREYSELLQQIHSELAVGPTNKDVRSSYLYFLALIFLMVGVVTIIVAYLFSSRLARSLSGPLADLSRASRLIAEGRFGEKVEPAGVGEVRGLIDSFNRMSERLEFTTTRLAQTERVAAWRSVARRFAHELKNPLQPIMISLHRLGKMLNDPSRYAEAAEPLRAASEELTHLVDLADRFSQLAKLPEPKLEEINLSELLKSIAILYRDRMESYRFEVDIPDHPITAELDATYFREALHNLLQNAADASAEGGMVRMALSADRDEINITIEDHGAGMSPDTVTAARMPYFTTKQHGKGLGLAIVEKVVTECGGRLFIDSREGAGTRITISLSRGDRPE